MQANEIFVLIISTIFIMSGIGILVGLYISFKKQNKYDLKEWEKRNHIPIYEKQISDLNSEVTIIKNKVRQIDRDIDPIIQERKKVEKLKAMKSFNQWKMIHVHDDEQCGDCFGHDISLEKEYSEGVGWLKETKSYPLYAEYKCNDCGHVISQWRYEDEEI